MGDWEPEDEEHDNIRAALAWGREAAQVDLELQLASAAGMFYWPNRGHLTEWRRWLDEAITRPQYTDERRRARALAAAATHAWRRGDHERSDELAAEAQTVLERLDDNASLAHALMTRAIAAEWGGDLGPEAAYYDIAEKIFRKLGNTQGLHSIVNNRAYAEILVGNFESAERRLSELVGLAVGNAKLFAMANHGLALARLGRFDEARAQFAQALPDRDEVEIIFYALEGLASVAGKQADDMLAAQLWAASAAIRESGGYALSAAEQRFHDDVVPEVRERLGGVEFDRAWNEGRQLPLEHAIELALGAR
jgi:tetratricopeptide (TPR) repeat protein